MYPIVVNMQGRSAVVVGGGRVAERKVARLIEAGASVRVISPEASAELTRQAEESRIVWVAKAFEPSDLDGALLVFATTGDDAVNAAVVAAARERGILVDDASDAARGDFATPALYRNGPITIAVDTGGASPSFAQRVRDAVGATVGDRYGKSARALAAARTYASTALPPDLRRAVLHELAARNIDALAKLTPVDAENEVDAIAQRLRSGSPKPPEIHASFVCASRTSPLAMTQTRTVMAALARGGISSTVVGITTTGDRLQDQRITELRSENVFVKEIEVALREKRADYAVHSCKDLPSFLPPDMQLAAVTERVDPRDVYCSEKFPTFDLLPAGARVGTSSPRRLVQLAALRADLKYEPIRGNIDTRLRKLREGGYDAIVLAAAGIDRLDVGARHTVPFSVDHMVPAVGQGALGIETRRDDPIVGALREHLNDAKTELAVCAERAFLREMRGGCSAPIAAYAMLEGDRMTLRAAVGLERLNEVLRKTRQEEIFTRVEAEALGAQLAAELAAARFELAPLDGSVFVLARTQGGPSRIAPALREAGAEVIEAYSVQYLRETLHGRVPDAILFPSSRSVNVLGDYLEELRLAPRRPIVATAGPTSGAAAEELGWKPDVVAPSGEAPKFVAAITHFILERGMKP